MEVHVDDPVEVALGLLLERVAERRDVDDVRVLRIGVHPGVVPGPLADLVVVADVFERFGLMLNAGRSSLVPPEPVPSSLGWASPLWVACASAPGLLDN